MGYDVCQIGLHHNLPINDPMAMMKEIAERLHYHVTLVYEEVYRYIPATKTVVGVLNGDLHPLAEYKASGSNQHLLLRDHTYQARNLREEIGVANLSSLHFANAQAKNLLRDPAEEGLLYETFDDDNDLHITIRRDTIALGQYYDGRWSSFAEVFKNPDFNREALEAYRQEIYERAQLFGCSSVYYFSDQYPTSEIEDRYDLTAEELRQFVSERKYLDPSRKDYAHWLQHGKQVYFADLFSNSLNLGEDDFVEVVMDDFLELK